MKPVTEITFVGKPEQVAPALSRVFGSLPEDGAVWEGRSAAEEYCRTYSDWMTSGAMKPVFMAWLTDDIGMVTPTSKRRVVFNPATNEWSVRFGRLGSRRSAEFLLEEIGYVYLDGKRAEVGEDVKVFTTNVRAVAAKQMGFFAGPTDAIYPTHEVGEDEYDRRSRLLLRIRELLEEESFHFAADCLRHVFPTWYNEGYGEQFEEFRTEVRRLVFRSHDDEEEYRAAVKLLREEGVLPPR